MTKENGFGRNAKSFCLLYQFVSYYASLITVRNFDKSLCFICFILGPARPVIFKSGLILEEQYILNEQSEYKDGSS